MIPLPERDMRIYDIDKKCYVDIVKYDDPATKAEQLADSLYCYQHNIFKVVYDQSQPALKSYIATLDNALLHEEKMQWLFFTSGTTGTPTGVYKTKQNSYEQAQALIKTLKGMKFDRVVTTVPFVHIYGIDIGGVVPFELDIDVWVKENFLPEELILEAQKEHTLIVTTPLFIKALNRIKKGTKFENTLFLTSTAPLSAEEAKAFKEHYGASVVQMFASTETGLISYKTDDETIRKGLKGFSGVKRRFTRTGAHNGITVFDDYGHHPVEIASVLGAARSVAKNKVIAVVQPHRYTRLRDLFDEFSCCCQR